MNETQQEHEDIIIVLTDELTIGATIVPEADNSVVPVYVDATIKPKLEQFLSSLKDHNPTIMIGGVQEDGSSFSGFREVSSEDPDYFTAIVDEANRQGLTVLVMPVLLYTIVQPALPQLSIENRKKVLDEILTMSPEDAVTFAQDLEEAYGIAKESL